MEENTIYVYSLSVPEWQAKEDECRRMLSAGEQSRASRFSSGRDAARFIFGRALLRLLVSPLLGTSPGATRFVYGPKGKPALEGPDRPEFNLSHCADMVFAALSRKTPVGVDVERRRTNIEDRDLALRFFSTYENAFLSKLPEAARLDGFFRFWTRKEAYLKACGIGVTVPLREVDVSSPPERNGKIPVRAGRAGGTDCGDWRIRDIAAPEGYFAAVAARGRRWSLKRVSLAPDSLAANGTLQL